VSGLDRLNGLSAAEAEADLLACCGSRAWAREVVRRRPFGDLDRLLSAADEAWWGLGEADWREAFRSHPRIGERDAETAQAERDRRWSAKEQAGMDAAAETIRQDIADGNRAYEARFGYIFIVCASGRSAEEMLSLLRERLRHDPASEIRVAAGEQARITGLRLQKLLAPEPEPSS
jgi:OHCU decarboxylase